MVLVGHGLLAAQHLLVGIKGFPGFAYLVDVHCHGGLGTHVFRAQRRLQHLLDRAR